MPEHLAAVSEIVKTVDAICKLTLDQCPSFDFQKVAKVMPDATTLLDKLKNAAGGDSESEVHAASQKLEDALLRIEEWIGTTLGDYAQDLDIIKDYTVKEKKQVEGATLEHLCEVFLGLRLWARVVAVIVLGSFMFCKSVSNSSSASSVIKRYTEMQTTSNN